MNILKILGYNIKTFASSGAVVMKATAVSTVLTTNIVSTVDINKYNDSEVIVDYFEKHEVVKERALEYVQRKEEVNDSYMEEDSSFSFEDEVQDDMVITEFFENIEPVKVQKVVQVAKNIQPIANSRKVASIANTSASSRSYSAPAPAKYYPPENYGSTQSVSANNFPQSAPYIAPIAKASKAQKKAELPVVDVTKESADTGPATTVTTALAKDTNSPSSSSSSSTSNSGGTSSGVTFETAALSSDAESVAVMSLLNYSSTSLALVKNSVMNPELPTTDGTGTLSFTVTPTLPTGMSLNALTGEITGIPSIVSATTTYTISLTDGTTTLTQAIDILVNDELPTGLSYTSATPTYVKNTAIANNTASNTGGNIDSYSVTPALPAGLSLNSTTGIISGTPSAVTASAAYTVTGTNETGSTNFSITILVNDELPSALSYTSNTVSYIINDAISNNSPTNSGGDVDSYSVAPALPSGLSLNTTTGVISGTPTSITASATYTVTATNETGSTTKDLTIEIVNPSATTFMAKEGEATSDRFGSSTANAGDFNNDGFDDVVVGAPEFGSSKGKVYVYSGSDGSLLFSKEGENNGDKFGFSVSGAGDFNSDGYADIVVGAPRVDNHILAQDNGKIYVYSGFDGSLLFSRLGEALEDEMGTGVLGINDVNNDGVNDLLIGAPYKDSSALVNSGRIYVIAGGSGAELYKVSGNKIGGQLGWYLAATGDLNSDGVDDFIVSAHRYETGAFQFERGRVYIISGSNGAVIDSLDGQANYDEFGSAIVSNFDYNDDGTTDIAIGAHKRNSNGADAGTVYIYSGSDRSLITSYNGENADDRFGTALTTTDTNNDGLSDLLVGAPWYNGTAGTDTGKIYIYKSGSSYGLSDSYEGAKGNDQLGLFLEKSGDADKDGKDDEYLAGSAFYDAPAKADAGHIMLKSY